MKKLLFLLFSLAVFSAFGQHRYYATILDKENNLLARGIFLRATDTGIVIGIDHTPVIVRASDIYLLKIEKNPTRMEFIKAGTAIAAESLLTAAGNTTDSLPAGTDDFDSSPGRQKLASTLQEVLSGLLDKTNDIACIAIEGSSARLKSKLQLLQQYSLEPEPAPVRHPPATGRPVAPIKNKTALPLPRPVKPVPATSKF